MAANPHEAYPGTRSVSRIVVCRPCRRAGTEPSSYRNINPPTVEEGFWDGSQESSDDICVET